MPSVSGIALARLGAVASCLACAPRPAPAAGRKRRKSAEKKKAKKGKKAKKDKKVKKGKAGKTSRANAKAKSNVGKKSRSKGGAAKESVSTPPVAAAPARPWEQGGAAQSEKIASTQKWLASQRKKLGLELVDGFDPVKVKIARGPAPKQGEADPLIAKLRRMGEQRGRGMQGVMDDAAERKPKPKPKV
eukprot:COSAG01_NODE_82_length_27810_cov_36.968352_12_plen_189_part_00